MNTLNTEQAQFCAGIFNDYFGQFSRIDQYMRDQKLAQIKGVPTALPGMGLDDDMFDDGGELPDEDEELELGGIIDDYNDGGIIDDEED